MKNMKEMSFIERKGASQILKDKGFHYCTMSGPGETARPAWGFDNQITIDEEGIFFTQDLFDKKKEEKK